MVHEAAHGHWHIGVLRQKDVKNTGRQRGVQRVIHTGCKGLEVCPDGILCETKDGAQVLVPGTSVICALGQRSRTADVEALRDAAPFVRVIGDAARVSTITNAVYWGYHAALDI